MIGLFDSGFGGLTVLSSVAKALPDRQLLFFGDHAMAPYGNRSRDEIYDLTRRSVERLFGLGCPLVVLACNTAAATALRRLQQDWLPTHYPERRILGVLVPVVEAITGVPWMADLASLPPTARDRRTIAVFATRQTVESNAYPTEIRKRAPEVSVVQQACPQLASLLEAGAPTDEIRSLVHRYVAMLDQQMEHRAPDVVMLGCTHYPLVSDMFAEVLPAGIKILSQPDLVARSLTAYLARHPEFDAAEKTGGIRYYTSGEPAVISRLASQFIQRPITFEKFADMAPQTDRRPHHAAAV